MNKKPPLRVLKREIMVAEQDLRKLEQQAINTFEEIHTLKENTGITLKNTNPSKSIDSLKIIYDHVRRYLLAAFVSMSVLRLRLFLRAFRWFLQQTGLIFLKGVIDPTVRTLRFVGRWTKRLLVWLGHCWHALLSALISRLTRRRGARGPEDDF